MQIVSKIKGHDFKGKMVSTFVMLNTINFRINLTEFGFSLFVLLGQENGVSVKLYGVIRVIR